MLKKVITNEDILEFGKCKVDLIKEHQYYANLLKLNDTVVDKYNIKNAIKHIGKKIITNF